MQKEDLLKKLRLWATIITSAFVVLIVALIVQFGFIAYNNARINDLKRENAANEELLTRLEKDLEYYQSDAYRDSLATENGKRPS